MDMTIEQEISAFAEALNSPEGQTLLQILDATAPRLQEIHSDIEDLNNSLAKLLLKLEAL